MNEDSHLEADYEDRTAFDDFDDDFEDSFEDSFYDEDYYEDEDLYNELYDDENDEILERQELEDFEQADEYYGSSAEDMM